MNLIEREKAKQAERKNVLSGILTPLKTGTRVSFPFFFFVTMVQQGMNKAGKDGPSLQTKAFVSMTTEQLQK